MKAMLEPRIVAARTHRAVARAQGEGSVERRIASSQGPLAATLIAESRLSGYAEGIVDDYRDVWLVRPLRGSLLQ
jgi:hypothetical protein